MTTSYRPGPVGRVATIVGAVALGMIGVAGIAGPAAADSSVGNLPAGPYTLNVHKFEQPAALGTDNGGEPIDTSGLTPIAGVTFSVQRVTSIDLSTAAGWEQTRGLTAEAVLAAPATYPLDAGTSETTDGGGLASFTDEPLGVYLVQETGTGANPITNPAPPFLVTLPFPNDNDWLTTVNVYPKNPVTGVTKTVDDSAAHGLGSTVTWTISATVPQLGQNALTSFVVSDNLDARLSYSASAPATVALSDGTAVPASDYVIAATGSPTAFSVTFTSAGLSFLQGHQGAHVVVTIPTTVTSIGDGTIQNTPLLNVNGTDVTGTPVQTTWGAVKIVKSDESTPSKALQGAQFQAYLSQADAANGTNPIAVSGNATFTTGTDGSVTIEGLRTGTYYLVETRAPAGYQVAPGFTRDDPQAVTVTTSSVDQPGVTLNVKDPQEPPFTLPLTGSTGTALFIGGGAALILIAIGTAIVVRRRTRWSSAAE